MRSLLTRLSEWTAPGAAPGTLVINKQSPRPQIRVMDYNASRFMEQDISDPREVIPFLTDGIESITWIDVHGLGDEAMVRELGMIFDIHPLTLEDVVHVGQRPKTEDFESHRFVVSRMVEYADDRQLATEQLSMFLGQSFLLTFQEFPGDTFDPVRDRLRRNKGMIRKMGPDFLMYSLLDSVIDHFFPVMERFGEELEELEDEVVLRPLPPTLGRIHRVKSGLLSVRRAIWPTRDMVNSLMRDESPLIRPETRLHIRDCYDHTVQVMDMVETYRELASGLLDVYISSVANRTNEVMKVLTMVTTVFVPLSFIAALYGMNFDPSSSPYNMPELRWRFGYPAVLASMAAITATMLVVFIRAGWIGGTRGQDDLAAAWPAAPAAPPPAPAPPAQGPAVAAQSSPAPSSRVAAPPGQPAPRPPGGGPSDPAPAPVAPEPPVAAPASTRPSGTAS